MSKVNFPIRSSLVLEQFHAVCKIAKDEKGKEIIDSNTDKPYRILPDLSVDMFLGVDPKDIPMTAKLPDMEKINKEMPEIAARARKAIAQVTDGNNDQEIIAMVQAVDTVRKVKACNDHRGAYTRLGLDPALKQTFDVIKTTSAKDADFKAKLAEFMKTYDAK